LVAVLGAFIGLGVGNPVQAASYTFSFGNVDGAVNGNVSGTIVLPDGDGTFAALSLTIDAYPAALNLGPPPIVSFILEIRDTFTVFGGNITSGEFVGNINNLTDIFIASSFLGGGSGLDLLNCGCRASQGVLDSGGSTLTFAAETPLPAALPLFASGLGALGLLGWRRKKKAAAIAA
jgi:hypothetical protein